MSELEAVELYLNGWRQLDGLMCMVCDRRGTVWRFNINRFDYYQRCEACLPEAVMRIAQFGYRAVAGWTYDGTVEFS